MQTDVLIIGCGIAGATAALRLASDRQRQITLITNTTSPIESNSTYAQGGIIGFGVSDSRELLKEDILRAGAGLCYLPAVEILAEEGPALVSEILIESAGMDFDRDSSGQHVLGLEGAHSIRRVLHVGDTTGRAIMTSLLRRVSEQPNITLMSQHTAVDLITFPHHARDPLEVYQSITCQGAYVFDQVAKRVHTLLAGRTILATGGLGQIYLNTSNPSGARGDGLAMAYRAGARVINSEYVQFHPTTLHMPGVTKFLISEAVRGEGGVLLTPEGERFMEHYDPDWKDLAPRDVVARAIYWQMLEHDYPYVLLDIASNKKPDEIHQRFPHIYKSCLELNIDITQQPIPVVPAAHYFCGGVLVDIWGRTTIPGLYAVGEVSCTGLHGANRLASSSLLEGLVWGDRSARCIQQATDTATPDEGEVPPWDESGLVYDADPSLIQGDMQTIRNLMWHYVGLVRSEYRLKRAIRELRHLWHEVEEFYRKSRLSDRLIGLRNSVLVGLVVARAAERNKISRGSHYREENFLGGKTATPPEVY
ncbi:MAG: L-aspartate oxidase [Anaerolineales bacterium]|nr:L-aspartate oxidase [Anaerolineales bacterium]